MNGTRPRCRELAKELSDSGRLVTLVRRLALRCNRDGKAFREREGVRLKVVHGSPMLELARSDLDSRAEGIAGTGGWAKTQTRAWGNETTICVSSASSEPWNWGQIIYPIGCPGELRTRDNTLFESVSCELVSLSPA